MKRGARKGSGRGRRGGAKSKRGGARPGAGQPRSALGDALLKSIGEPPEGDPIAAALWLHGALLKLWWAEAKGECPPSLAERLRATAGAVMRSLPDSAKAELDRRLKKGATKRTGPAPEPARTDGPPTYRG